MKNSFKHLVFYDHECVLCDKLVQFIIKIDHRQEFAFAPLKGTTAQKYLPFLPVLSRTDDTLILVENFKSPWFKIHLFSQAVLRIFCLIGRGWAVLGSLYFLPSILFNWIYCLVARYRYQFLPKDSCASLLPGQEDRFLP
jgi:predicted DCC family thiol-disulfide oxidoreductase YuxK